MRERGKTAPTANTLSHPSAIHQPARQAVPLALGSGNVVAIGMESNASFQKQICLKFINLGDSTRRSSEFLELYNHATHRDLCLSVG